MTGLVDVNGQPLRRAVLTQEVAGPTIGSVRSPIGGYPADGLNPMRLANILREADQGDALRYFELAELIEERDSHYAAVLGTRKRSVAQIDVTIEPGGESALDIEMADMVRQWIDRDELADEMFDILDAIGKGISFTEIIWDTSMGQYRPGRLEWRDPRWFTFDRMDGRTPLLRGGPTGNGEDTPLDPFKFIQLSIKAKSGLPVRSGIARIAAWNWMFKGFTQRDWAIFAQTFGQPVRVGKFHPGATKEDRATLFRAVANIAGDCAAIIPEGMMIEFIESANVGAGADLYEKRANWLDGQTSKAVLGQTGTTDMKSGGLGDGGNQVHDRVAGDIEAADCKAAAACLNRDLVRPWIDLEYGPQSSYPRLRIARKKREDLIGLADALAKLVPLGFEVEQSEIHEKFGLTAPAAGAKLLRPPASAQQPAMPERIVRGAAPVPAAAPSLHAQGTGTAAFPADAIGDQLLEDGAPAMEVLIAEIETMMAGAADFDELKAMMASAYLALDVSRLASTLALGFAAAGAAGMSDAEAESA
ncbi:MAG: DUF935 domain-containing protein [Pseudomonadota bacterium]